MYITHHQYQEKRFSSTMCNHLTDAGTLLNQKLIQKSPPNFMHTITIINHKSTKVPISSLRNPVLNTRTTKYTTYSSKRKTSINASLALLRNVFPKLSFFFFLGGPPPSILELPLVRRGSFHHFDSSSSSSYQPDFSIEGEMVASWKNCGDDGVGGM